MLGEVHTYEKLRMPPPFSSPPPSNPLPSPPPRESADGLVKATRASYDASLARFDQGLVPVQDVLTAQAAWSQAIALLAESDSAIGATLAALAFGSGKLAAAILRGQSRRPEAVRHDVEYPT